MLSITHTQQQELKKDEAPADLRHQIKMRSAQLEKIGAELKCELIGINDIIDKVIVTRVEN
jgi:hypothetical protein